MENYTIKDILKLYSMGYSVQIEHGEITRVWKEK